MPDTFESLSSSSIKKITKKTLLDICKKNKLYQTPHLNDVLYLHYQGFGDIENLDEYTGLKCLWLECNAISEIKGLEKQTKLKCLFLQNNLIKKIENLEPCKELDNVNLANNHILRIENCGSDILPELTSLNLSHNCLRTYENLKELVNCKKLSVCDLSNNRIEDILVVKIFSEMPELRVLVLQGNPVVNDIPQYRKTLILECKQLTYLDSRPVFPRDRACAEAWKRGGYDEERREHARWNKQDRKRIRDSVNATLRLRNRGGGDPNVDLIPSSDDDINDEFERSSAPPKRESSDEDIPRGVNKPVQVVDDNDSTSSESSETSSDVKMETEADELIPISSPSISGGESLKSKEGETSKSNETKPMIISDKSTDKIKKVIKLDSTERLEEEVEDILETAYIYHNIVEEDFQKLVIEDIDMDVRTKDDNVCYNTIYNQYVEYVNEVMELNEKMDTITVEEIAQMIEEKNQVTKEISKIDSADIITSEPLCEETEAQNDVMEIISNKEDEVIAGENLKYCEESNMDNLISESFEKNNENQIKILEPTINSNESEKDNFDNHKVSNVIGCGPNKEVLDSKPIEVLDLIEIVDPKPTEILYSKAIEILDSEPIELLDSKPIEVLDSKLIEVIDSKPIEVIDSKPIEVSDSKLIEVVDSKQTEGIDSKLIEVIDSKPVEVIDSKQIEVVDSKQTEGIDSKLIEVIDSKPVEVIDSKPVEVIDSKPVEVIDSKPIEVPDSKLIEVVDSKQTEVIDSKLIEFLDSKPTEVLDTKPVEVLDSSEVADPDSTAVQELEQIENFEMKLKVLAPNHESERADEEENAANIEIANTVNLLESIAHDFVESEEEMNEKSLTNIDRDEQVNDIIDDIINDCVDSPKPNNHPSLDFLNIDITTLPYEIIKADKGISQKCKEPKTEDSSEEKNDNSNSPVDLTENNELLDQIEKWSVNIEDLMGKKYVDEQLQASNSIPDGNDNVADETLEEDKQNADDANKVNDEDKKSEFNEIFENVDLDHSDNSLYYETENPTNIEVCPECNEIPVKDNSGKDDCSDGSQYFETEEKCSKSQIVVRPDSAVGKIVEADLVEGETESNVADKINKNSVMEGTEPNSSIPEEVKATSLLNEQLVSSNKDFDQDALINIFSSSPELEQFVKISMIKNADQENEMNKDDSKTSEVRTTLESFKEKNINIQKSFEFEHNRTLRFEKMLNAISDQKDICHEILLEINSELETIKRDCGSIVKRLEKVDLLANGPKIDNDNSDGAGPSGIKIVPSSSQNIVAEIKVPSTPEECDAKIIEMYVQDLRENRARLDEELDTRPSGSIAIKTEAERDIVEEPALETENTNDLVSESVTTKDGVDSHESVDEVEKKDDAICDSDDDDDNSNKIAEIKPEPKPIDLTDDPQLINCIASCLTDQDIQNFSKEYGTTDYKSMLHHPRCLRNIQSILNLEMLKCEKSEKKDILFFAMQKIQDISKLFKQDYDCFNNICL